MINKIKEALKQGHRNLGLSDEVFERVAASVKTFITDESMIEAFVKNESTLNLLKSYQSVNDKLRAYENKKTEKPAEQSSSSDESKEPTTPSFNHEDIKNLIHEDMQNLLAEAVSSIVQPLKDELAGFKSEQLSKNAVTEAEAIFKGNDYVKKYLDEGNEAWEHAMEIYQLNKKFGTIMTAEQLNEKALDYLGRRIGKKGEELTKPIQGDGGSQATDDFNVEEIKNALRAKGNLPAENQPE